MKAINLLLGFLSMTCVTVYGQNYNLIHPYGCIEVSGGLYNDELTMQWNIGTGQNREIKFEYTIDLEYECDYVRIYNKDNTGNLTLVASLTGQISGTVSTTIPNGKAVVVFTSDESGSGDLYTGFTFNYTPHIGNDFPVSSDLHLIGDIFVQGKMAINTKQSSEQLMVNGDISLGLPNSDRSNGYGDKLFFRGGGSGWNEEIFMSRFRTGLRNADLRLSLGSGRSGTYKFVVGNIDINDTNKKWAPFFTVVDNGRVGINTDNPQYALDVKGAIRATEIKVETIENFPDYVFSDAYHLPSLKEVNQFIKSNKHLPGIPTASDVKANGIDLVEMQVKLLQKIEELTLYTIEQQKKIEQLERTLQDMIED